MQITQKLRKNYAYYAKWKKLRKNYAKITQCFRQCRITQKLRKLRKNYANYASAKKLRRLRTPHFADAEPHDEHGQGGVKVYPELSNKN